VAVAAPPVPALVSSAPRYLRRTYILFNLTRPCDMISRGVRDFLASHFRRRPIGEQVCRAKKKKILWSVHSSPYFWRREQSSSCKR
jgi:hypothetical protein